MELKERISQLLGRLETSGILQVEWETTLLTRLGYPLARTKSLFLLVPDHDLPAVQQLAASCGLAPADDAALKPAYPCEQADGALRYPVEDSVRRIDGKEPLISGPPRDRLVFVPLSWTGLRRSELVPVAGSGEPDPLPRTPRLGRAPAVPPHVWTVPLAATCAALVRIIAREQQHSLRRQALLTQLTSVICYNLYDSSYEGDYDDIPGNDVPLSEDEQRQIALAVADIRAWKMRPEEEWLKEELAAMFCGKKHYDDLPSLDTGNEKRTL